MLKALVDRTLEKEKTRLKIDSIVFDKNEESPFFSMREERSRVCYFINSFHLFSQGKVSSVVEKEKARFSHKEKKMSPSRNVDEDGKGHKNKKELRNRQEDGNKSGDGSTSRKKRKGETKHHTILSLELIQQQQRFFFKESSVSDDNMTIDSNSGKKKKTVSSDQSTNPCNLRDRPQNSIEYQLSNPVFVELGWTVLPIIRNRMKIVEYETVASKPQLNRLKMPKREYSECYEGGLVLFLHSHANGSAEIYYPNGKLAMKLYSSKERNYDMYTVFTPGGKDSSGIERESQITAIFDSLGNGVVFDEVGATRLSYNQFGGFSRDYPGRPPYSWPWAMQTAKATHETVYLEKSMVDLKNIFFRTTRKVITETSKTVGTQETTSLRNKNKMSIASTSIEESQEVMEEESHLPMKNFKDVSFPIKPISLKINDYFSLRIFDRRNISLRFSACRKKIKIELGTILNFNKVQNVFYIEGDWKTHVRKNRFHDTLTKSLPPNSSMYNLIQEYQKISQSMKRYKKSTIEYINFLYKRNVIKYMKG
ncbi:uncharacterized protein [Prorops nasuta]|uniref:uncharacterized protein n=1 Tax=Prorops nasuta TaxID=863751 RepID=UPI0034D01AE2